MVSHRISRSRNLNANYSVLGRLIRRSVKDAHYAEGILILTIALLCISMVVFFYIGWAFVEPIITADTSGQAAAYYFFGQLGSFLLLFFVALLGFKPGLEIDVDAHCLHIKQGKQRMLVLFNEIQHADSISAKEFHQHYRKYINTRAFYNRLSGNLLLLDTDNGPVILGLSEEDQATLRGALRSSASQENKLSFEFVA